MYIPKIPAGIVDKSMIESQSAARHVVGLIVH